MTPRQQRVAVFGAFVATVVVSAGVYFWSAYEERITGAQTYVPRVEKITPEVVLLQQYVRVNTSNPPGNELAGARWLATRLEKFGVPYEIIESAPGRGNLYARLKGRRPGEGLLLLNHIDVMPATPAGWHKPPFAGETRLNMLVGRGVLDMKGIAICQLEAFLEVARSGRQPERDLVFLATADEEAGSRFGVPWLLEHRPELFDGIRYVLNEGGVTETKEEQITVFGIEIGTKAVVTAELRAPTREQLQRARIALEPRFAPTEADRVLPEVQRYLAAIAPYRVEQRELLADVKHTIAIGKVWLLARGYRELLQNVVWAEGVVDDRGGYAMRTRLFNLPDENPDARIEWLTETVKPFGVTVDVTVKEGPIPLSSDLTPFFALLRREIREQHGDVTVSSQILAGGTSNDSRFLRARGIACYGMWPYKVDWFQTQGIHGVDERLRLDWFQEGVELMKRIVGAYVTEASIGR